MGLRACSHLDEAIRSVISRHACEYKLGYAELIGVLEIVKQDMIREFYEREKEEDDD